MMRTTCCLCVVQMANTELIELCAEVLGVSLDKAGKLLRARGQNFCFEK